MIRFRTLLAAALVTIPVLALPASASTGGASRSPNYDATSAPPACIMVHGILYCY